jgi:hypothetical protein
MHSVPLLKRSEKNQWEPRDCVGLSEDIGTLLGLPIDISSKIGGLRAISNALNKGNIAQAQIAAVLLGIPEAPSLKKNAHTKSEMIKFIRDLDWSGLIKADWDPVEHPRWPAGAPDSHGDNLHPRRIRASADEAKLTAADGRERKERNGQPIPRDGTTTLITAGPMIQTTSDRCRTMSTSVNIWKMAISVAGRATRPKKRGRRTGLRATRRKRRRPRN